MKKGFTLIELMIVVVIIGILAAIAIPNFVKIIDKAKEASVKANMHTVQVTVETYAVDEAGQYPSAIADFEDDLPANFANPYDSGSDALVDDEAANAGEVGYEDWTDLDGYTITGYGKDDLLDLTLTPGVTGD